MKKRLLGTGFPTKTPWGVGPGYPRTPPRPKGENKASRRGRSEKPVGKSSEAIHSSVFYEQLAVEAAEKAIGVAEGKENASEKRRETGLHVHVLERGDDPASRLLTALEAHSLNPSTNR